MITASQRNGYFSRWKEACIFQGWTRENGFTKDQIDTMRHQEQATALKGTVKSSNDLTNPEVDKVFAYFEMLAEKLKGTIETDRPDLGHGRRLRWVIKNELIPCLGLYVDHPEDYVLQIMRDKFHAYPGLRSLEDLKAYCTRPGSPSELDQLRMTLVARLEEKRKEAGDTVREMKIKAGIIKPRQQKPSKPVTQREEAVAASVDCPW